MHQKWDGNCQGGLSLFIEYASPLNREPSSTETQHATNRYRWHLGLCDLAQRGLATSCIF
jgi:hypothetical protein